MKILFVPYIFVHINWYNFTKFVSLLLIFSQIQNGNHLACSNRDFFRFMYAAIIKCAMRRCRDITTDRACRSLFNILQSTLSIGPNLYRVRKQREPRTPAYFTPEASVMFQVACLLLIYPGGALMEICLPATIFHSFG